MQFHSWVFWMTGQKLQTQLKFTRHVLSIPAITEELAQEAFIKYASSKCCYSSKPAKQMVFTDLQSLNTYRVSSNFHIHHIQLYIAAMLTSWIPVSTNSTGWRLLLSPEQQNGTVNHTMVSKVILNHIFIYNSKMKLNCIFKYVCPFIYQVRWWMVSEWLLLRGASRCPFLPSSKTARKPSAFLTHPLSK